jgi:hypothetical protein
MNEVQSEPQVLPTCCKDTESIHAVLVRHAKQLTPEVGVAEPFDTTKWQRCA